MSHILIAPNSFKHALEATAAAKAIERGVLSTTKHVTTCFPIGDGGDGTAKLIVEGRGGRWVDATVTDPLGRSIDTCFGLIDDDQTAVIEMANASGIRLLKENERDPKNASSFGTGQLMTEALDLGVKKIILAMGGSATVDGGMGILRALGMKMFDGEGKEVVVPADLVTLHRIQTSYIDPRALVCEVIVLCDVQNVLLGHQGAASVFGPQKGATASDIMLIEQGLHVFSELCIQITGRNMQGVIAGGTAGGAAAGLYGFLEAKLVSGIEYFLDLLDFDKVLNGIDAVITGEGSLDEQTLHGKGPMGVARRAAAQHIPVIGVAGIIKDDDALQPWFKRLICINEVQRLLDQMIADTEMNLERIGKEIGEGLAVSP